ncbi:tRNA1(Val) (adenine(37)-N6)-methyltransferase [Shewanella surugensis]|uniref:tRNA1(Val) (adenine(37)-N6)-methyltransferase n=1 Tax=Shewanella surugensis TaxID=212020 RepID=A0ABT0LI87_9GAMM|nr:methyltransferase [Shewanella surugensis]MCL1127423.1 methyltransferase [Shewanella surugensis]
MPFTFKQFHIDDSHCGMPVSTDGVLLGAWAKLTQARTVLDIGAGSGLLSLMAAQRSQAYITAIELDDDAIKACQHNFNASLWSERLMAHHCAIQDFIADPLSFEHIICNPPYFTNGPQALSASRSAARHTDTLNFDELLSAIKKLLSQTGTASLILPSVSLQSFLTLLPRHQLNLQQIVDVASVEGKSVNRHLISLNHVPSKLDSLKAADQIDAAETVDALSSPRHSHLDIRTKTGQYTNMMRELTEDFYLKL